MASSKADSMVFSSSVNYISAMLSLSGPISLPRVFHQIKLSPFSSEIGNSIDEFQFFLLNHCHYFRIKVDVRNVHNFEGEFSNKIVSLKPAALVPIAKDISPRSKSNNVVLTEAVECPPIKMKFEKQLPSSRDCKDAVTMRDRICGNSDSVTPEKNEQNSMEKLKGRQMLEVILNKKGSLPIHRLMGHVLNMKRPVREAVGKNASKLLKFLVEDDRFNINGSDCVVSLNTQAISKSTSERCLEVRDKNSDVTPRSKKCIPELIENKTATKKISNTTTISRNEFQVPSAQITVTECTSNVTAANISSTEKNVQESMKKGQKNMIVASNNKSKEASISKLTKIKHTSDLNDLSVSSRTVCNLDVCEGVRVLRNVLLKRGPLPVFRLVGYLSNVNRSVRESVGKNTTDLLKFLKASDQFLVKDTEHVVYLKKLNDRSVILKECNDSGVLLKNTLTSAECIANPAKDSTVLLNSNTSIKKKTIIPEKDSIASIKSKPYLQTEKVISGKDGIESIKSKKSVKNKKVKSSTVKSAMVDPTSSHEKVQQNVGTDLKRAKIICKIRSRLAKQKMKKFFTKAILKKGPRSLYQLSENIRRMTKCFRDADDEFFAEYHNFLLNCTRFEIQTVEGVKEVSSIKLDSIISLNPEWLRSQECRKDASQKGSCDTLTKIVYPKSTMTSKHQNSMAGCAITPSQTFSATTSLAVLPILSTGTNCAVETSDTLTKDSTSTQIPAIELNSTVDKLVASTVIESFCKQKSMPFETLREILLNSSVPECRWFGENTNMLVKLLHERDFIIEGRDQVVRLMNQGEREHLLSHDDVRVSKKSAEGLHDLSKLTNNSVTDNRKLDFLRIMARYVSNVIQESGPISMSKLKQIFLSKLVGAEHYRVALNNFLFHHRDVFARIDDTVYLVQSKEYVSFSVNSAASVGFEEQISVPYPIDVNPAPGYRISVPGYRIVTAIERRHLNYGGFHTPNKGVSNSNISTKTKMSSFSSNHPCFGLNARKNDQSHEIKLISPSVSKADIISAKINNSSVSARPTCFGTHVGINNVAIKPVDPSVPSPHIISENFSVSQADISTKTNHLSVSSNCLFFSLNVPINDIAIEPVYQSVPSSHIIPVNQSVSKPDIVPMKTKNSSAISNHTSFSLNAHRNADKIKPVNLSVFKPDNIPKVSNSLMRARHPCFNLNALAKVNDEIKDKPAEDEIEQDYKTSFLLQQIRNRNLIRNPPQLLRNITDEQRRKILLQRKETLLPPTKTRYRSYFSKLGFVGAISPKAQKGVMWYISSPTDINGDDLQKVSTELAELTALHASSSCQSIMSQHLNSSMSHSNECANNQICQSENNKPKNNGDEPNAGLLEKIQHI